MRELVQFHFFIHAAGFMELIQSAVFFTGTSAGHFMKSDFKCEIISFKTGGTATDLIVLFKDKPEWGRLWAWIFGG